MTRFFLSPVCVMYVFKPYGNSNLERTEDCSFAVCKVIEVAGELVSDCLHLCEGRQIRGLQPSIFSPWIPRLIGWDRKDRASRSRVHCCELFRPLELFPSCHAAKVV